jgi:pantothenate synthetase
MSSRNARLSPAGRVAAAVLHRALANGVAAIAGGERDAAVVRATMEAELAAEPAVGPDYVSVADPVTLLELASVDGPALLSLAALVEGVRLIDNELAG